MLDEQLNKVEASISDSMDGGYGRGWKLSINFEPFSSTFSLPPSVETTFLKIHIVNFPIDQYLYEYDE